MKALTEEDARLIAAEHLLAEHLPQMQTMKRAELAIELRDLLTCAAKIEATKCLACHGRGERVHGWAICPGPCKDCGGTGEVVLEGRA